MSELFKEIEDDIRQERIDKLWRGVGKVMVGVSVAVICATVAIVVMQDRRQERAMAQTAQMIRGIDRLNIEDYKGAAAAFSALAADKSAPYYGIAMLRQAQAEEAAGDHEAAARSYAALAERDPAHDPFAELALMHAASPGKDALSMPAPSAPFYPSQGEWSGWELLGQGQKDETVVHFLALRDDPLTPPSMHERVSEALQYLAPESAEKKETAHE